MLPEEFRREFWTFWFDLNFEIGLRPKVDFSLTWKLCRHTSLRILRPLSSV